MRTTRIVLVLAVGLACEPELGRPCGDEEVVDLLVRQERGRNDLVQSVRFDGCSESLCASVDGSRPFCTRSCASDADCAVDDPAFTCAPIVQTGRLACDDFEDNPDCVDEDGTLSDQMNMFCTTSRAHIEERDQTVGCAE